jgi:hypothetical protein
MSGYEFLRWQLLEAIEPWGEKRADYRAAVIAWITVCGFSGKRKPAFKKILKMFEFGKGREQSDEEITQIFKAMAGGK